MKKKPSSRTATRSLRAAIDQLNRTLLFVHTMDRLPDTKISRLVCKHVNQLSRRVHNVTQEFNEAVKSALLEARNSK